MKKRNIILLVVLLLVADQALKIWIKTHLALGESITVFHDWFFLRFIENPGAAFGFELGGNNGKLFLSLFRIVAIGDDEMVACGGTHPSTAGQIGLASDPELREIALNTLEELNRWDDFNGTNSFYPAAVRLGYQADSILMHLHEYSLNTYPNGFQYDNPHGIENLSTVPNTINEMLCMGHQDIVRVFPVWPRTEDAKFHNIRVEGAFLVSSSLKDGQIEEVVLYSEKGRNLILQNPWPGKEVTIKGPGKSGSTAQGDMIHMNTEPGGKYVFRPAR